MVYSTSPPDPPRWPCGNVHRAKKIPGVARLYKCTNLRPRDKTMHALCAGRNIFELFRIELRTDATHFTRKLANALPHEQFYTRFVFCYAPPHWLLCHLACVNSSSSSSWNYLPCEHENPLCIQEIPLSIHRTPSVREFQGIPGIGLFSSRGIQMGIPTRLPTSGFPALGIPSKYI